MYLLTQRSVWELSCLSPSLSAAQGVYLCIHSLKDFQIAQIRLSPYKQKDLLQLVIDFPFILFAPWTDFDCGSNPAKTTQIHS